MEKLRVIWERLTRPDSSVPFPQRLRARLAASLILGFLLVGVLIQTAIILWVTPDVRLDFIVSGLIAVLLFGIAYILARRGHYGLGIWFLALVFNVMLFTGSTKASEPAPEASFVVYILLPIMITSIFASFRLSLAVILTTFAGLLYAFWGSAPEAREVIWQFSYLVALASVVTLIAGLFRHSLDENLIARIIAGEQSQRAELEQRVHKRTVELEDVNAVLRDEIKERKQIEQALQREKWRFEQLVELSPMGIAVHTEGVVTFTNTAGMHIFGAQDTSDILGKPALEFVHPDYRDMAIERIQSLLQPGIAAIEESTAAFVEEVFISQDGALIDVEVAAFPFSESGETAVQVVFHDITARKQAERTRLQHAHRLELLSEIDNASLTAQPMEEIARSALVSLRKLIPCQRAIVTITDSNASIVTLLAVDSADSIIFPPGTTYSTVDYRDLLPNLERGKGQIISDFEVMARTETNGEVWTKIRAASLAVVPLFIRGQLIGSLNLVSDKKDAFFEDHLDIAREVADRLAIAMQNAQYFSEITAANERLQALSHRLVQVQEEERQSIARELHDEIGQSLTALNLSLQLASHVPPDQIANRIGEAQKMIADLMNRTRELSLILRPAMLDDLGLTPTLEWFFEQYTRQVQIDVDFTYDGLDQQYGEEIDITVFRIIQEALTNVARHAHTSQVRVRLWQADNTISILIQDEGVGFDVEQAFRQTMSTGLSGMMERVNSLSGSFDIKSEPGTGVRITAQLPLSETSTRPQEDDIS